MYLVFFYIDGAFIDIANDTFTENASAILDEDVLDNETLGFGFMIYELPLGTPGNESIVNMTYSITLEDKIIIPSFGLLITNTTDDFDVEGGLEDHYLFIDALFTETMNKTMFDDLVGSLYYDGVFDIELTGCQFFDSSTTRIYADVNDEPATFEEEFFISP